jgi:hypothetical protein
MHITQIIIEHFVTIKDHTQTHKKRPDLRELEAQM